MVVKIRNHCTECGDIEYSKMNATQVQVDWIREHREHREHCPRCGHLGRDICLIDAGQIQTDYKSGQTPDIIAKLLGINEPEVVCELLPDQKKDWRRRVRSEKKRLKLLEKKARGRKGG